MVWWDWNTKQRLGLLVLMLIAAAAPLVALGWLPNEWQAFIGGLSFLLIPQIVGWFLFVGLRTGRIPSRYGSEYRNEAPVAFWMTVAIYALLVTAFLWFILAVVADAPLPGF